MFSSMKRWLGGEASAAREPIEVFGLCLVDVERGHGMAVRALFTDDEDGARDPIYLRKMFDRVWDLNEEADMCDLGRQVRYVLNWNFPDFQSPLCTMPEGFSTRAKLYAVDVMVPGRVLKEGFDGRDFNAGILRLEFDGTGVKLLGAVPADKVARRRLRLLEENGARRVDAQLVHANHVLFERDTVGGPSLVLFSFDRKTPREMLAETAELLHEWRDWETDDPELLAVIDKMRDGEQRSHYHQRFRLPETLTDGFEVYAGDLWIHRPYLRHGQLFEDDEDDEDDRILPCLAERGDKGGIDMVPPDEADDYR